VDDQYAIHMAKAELREGYNQGDTERVVAVYSDAVSDMSDGLPSMGGLYAKTVLRARLEAFFRDYDVLFAPMTIDLRVLGAIAIAHGWHGMTLTPKSGGAVVHRKMRFIEIWQRSKTDVWQIRMTLDNEDVAPEFPERLAEKINTRILDAFGNTKA
jgi:ketosteroid isomerase-like protein